MRKILPFLSAIALLASAVCYAQIPQSAKAAGLLREDPTRAGVNTNSYEFFPIVDTPAPKGYKAFYVSHYGRHGSRSNWGDASYRNVIETMKKAKEAGIITAEGEALMHEAQAVLDNYNGMDGRLTYRGEREHEMLASRLYARVPEVFKGGKNIRAIASTSQRCIVSMNGFTIGLTKKNPKLHFFLDTGEKYMDYLSDTHAGNSTRGSNEIIRRMWKETPDDSSFVMSHLFTDPQAARKFVKSSEKLTDDIFNTACISEDFDIEADIYRHLPFDAIYRRWANINRTQYLQHANSVEFGHERCAGAETLVQEIVRKADEVIASGEYAADLRFGHDHPIMGLVCYLGLSGVGERYTADQIDDNWMGFWELPMASNLQMIFYKNKAGHVLVKFLYNEKERLLRGLEPEQGPYYDWNTVKANIKGYLR